MLHFKKNVVYLQCQLINKNLKIKKMKSTIKEKFSIWSKRENSLIHFDTMEELNEYVVENPDDIMLSERRVVVKDNIMSTVGRFVVIKGIVDLSKS